MVNVPSLPPGSLMMRKSTEAQLNVHKSGSVCLRLSACLSLYLIAGGHVSATMPVKDRRRLKNMCVSLRTCGSAPSHFCFICSSLIQDFAASVCFCQCELIVCD